MAAHQGTALITGASTGIGATYAQRLAQRGYDLILVARNEAKLQSLARQLASESGVNVRIVVADLTQRADTAKVEQLLATDPAISLLVNNAGTATLEPLKSADVDKLEAEIVLNITAPTRLSHAVLPACWRAAMAQLSISRR